MITRAQTNRDEHGSPRRRQWLIEGNGGSPKLVSGAAEVRDLLDQGRISAESRVYEITTEPRRLRDIAELGHVIAEPLSSEPPVRGTGWSVERAQLSEELAILDRPLDDDVEYYDERPPSRGKGAKLALLALVVGGLGLGGFAARAHVPSLAHLGSAAGPPAAIAAPIAAVAVDAPAAPVAPTAVAVPPARVEAGAPSRAPEAVAGPQLERTPRHSSSRHPSSRRASRRH